MRSGFTLIELIVVVAIVGVLAAIAYPIYSSQVRKVRIAEAVTVLMENAQIMERQYAKTGSYANAPIVTSTPAYGISIDVQKTSDTAFEIKTTPTSGSVIKSSDSCAAMTINNLGVKTPTSCFAR